MKITKVRGKKISNKNSNLKARVEVTLDGCFVIKDIRIVERPDKTVVQMPNKEIPARNEDGTIIEGERTFYDVAHPINKETREMFNNTILFVYEKATEEEFEENF